MGRDPYWGFAFMEGGEAGESETKRQKEGTVRGQFIRQTNGLLISTPLQIQSPQVHKDPLQEGGVS